MLNKLFAKICHQIRECRSKDALSATILSCNSFRELNRLWRWEKEPLLHYLPDVPYEYLEDLNDRRQHDAEVLMTLCRNAVTTAALEIGTSSGLTTLGMALNAPGATIYTVDIPQEEAKAGEGGKLITHVLDPKMVGYHYRQAKAPNVQQIFANTATWQPDIPPLDLAFVDGCHDRKFVYNDTIKVLPFIKQGGFIVWHDANPALANAYGWIAEVCGALGDLVRDGKLPGKLFHVRDSWMTVWRKPFSMQDMKG